MLILSKDKTTLFDTVAGPIHIFHDGSIQQIIGEVQAPLGNYSSYVEAADVFKNMVNKAASGIKYYEMPQF